MFASTPDSPYSNYVCTRAAVTMCSHIHRYTYAADHPDITSNPAQARIQVSFESQAEETTPSCTTEQRSKRNGVSVLPPVLRPCTDDHTTAVIPASVTHRHLFVHFRICPRKEPTGTVIGYLCSRDRQAMRAARVAPISVFSARRPHPSQLIDAPGG